MPQPRWSLVVDAWTIVWTLTWQSFIIIIRFTMWNSEAKNVILFDFGKSHPHPNSMQKMPQPRRQVLIRGNIQYDEALDLLYIVHILSVRSRHVWRLTCNYRTSVQAWCRFDFVARLYYPSFLLDSSSWSCAIKLIQLLYFHSNTNIIMASGGNSHRWFLETGEDRCIYLIREAKRIGKVAAVRLIRETTDHPALIGVCICLW